MVRASRTERETNPHNPSGADSKPRTARAWTTAATPKIVAERSPRPMPSHVMAASSQGHRGSSPGHRRVIAGASPGYPRVIAGSSVGPGKLLADLHLGLGQPHELHLH